MAHVRIERNQLFVVLHSSSVGSAGTLRGGLLATSLQSAFDFRLSYNTIDIQLQLQGVEVEGAYLSISADGALVNCTLVLLEHNAFSVYEGTRTALRGAGAALRVGHPDRVQLARWMCSHHHVHVEASAEAIVSGGCLLLDAASGQSRNELLASTFEAITVDVNSRLPAVSLLCLVVLYF